MQKGWRKADSERQIDYKATYWISGWLRGPFLDAAFRLIDFHHEVFGMWNSLEPFETVFKTKIESLSLSRQSKSQSHENETLNHFGA